MIYTGQTYREGNKPSRHYDEMWSIMRSPTKGLKNPTIHHPELAPSKILFERFLQLKEVGDWCPRAFKEIYVPEYIRQVANDEKARATLNYLWQMNKEGQKDIILLCSCVDEETCHRSIVKGLLDLSGEYFQMYKEKYAEYREKQRRATA